MLYFQTENILISYYQLLVYFELTVLVTVLGTEIFHTEKNHRSIIYPHCYILRIRMRTKDSDRPDEKLVIDWIDQTLGTLYQSK